MFLLFYFFFFNDTATTEIYTLSLHDALPISGRRRRRAASRRRWARPDPWTRRWSTAGGRPDRTARRRRRPCEVRARGRSRGLLSPRGCARPAGPPAPAVRRRASRRRARGTGLHGAPPRQPAAGCLP